MCVHFPTRGHWIPKSMDQYSTILVPESQNLDPLLHYL